MARWKAPKQPKAMVPCGECGKPRPIGIEHMNNIEAGKSPNICRECIVRAKPNHGLGENEIRIKIKGKWCIRVRYFCADCGKEGNHARHKSPQRCKECAQTYRRVHAKHAPSGKFTPAKSVAKPVDTRPPGKYPIPAYRRGTRCHGLETKCPKYEECLDIAEDWVGWTCGDGSETKRYIHYVEDHADLKLHWEGPDRECPDLFEISSLGFDLSRTPARR